MKANYLVLHIKRAIGWGEFAVKNKNVGEYEHINNIKRNEIEIDKSPHTFGV